MSTHLSFSELLPRLIGYADENFCTEILAHLLRCDAEFRTRFFSLILTGAPQPKTPVELGSIATQHPYRGKFIDLMAFGPETAVAVEVKQFASVHYSRKLDAEEVAGQPPAWENQLAAYYKYLASLSHPTRCLVLLSVDPERIRDHITVEEKGAGSIRLVDLRWHEVMKLIRTRLASSSADPQSYALKLLGEALRLWEDLKMDGFSGFLPWDLNVTERFIAMWEQADRLLLQVLDELNLKNVDANSSTAQWYRARCFHRTKEQGLYLACLLGRDIKRHMALQLTVWTNDPAQRERLVHEGGVPEGENILFRCDGDDPVGGLTGQTPDEQVRRAVAFVQGVLPKVRKAGIELSRKVPRSAA